MILQAIDKLPQADREVLLLRDIEEMDTAATAARLETTEHNLTRRLRRARLALCTRLELIMTNEKSFAPSSPWLNDASTKKWGQSQATTGAAGANVLRKKYS